jgi:hypothetical protein
MERTRLNLNECFFIILTWWIKKEYILKKIKNTLDEKEFKAVSIFIDWIQKRHIDGTDKNLFDIVNFFNEDLLDLSLKVLAKKKQAYLEEIIKMVAIAYKWNFNLDLRGWIISYRNGKISF